VDDSYHELQFLQQKLSDQKLTVKAVQEGIKKRKGKATLNKTSDSAMIIFLKGMTELREIEIQKNMIDFVL